MEYIFRRMEDALTCSVANALISSAGLSRTTLQLPALKIEQLWSQKHQAFRGLFLHLPPLLPQSGAVVPSHAFLADGLALLGGCCDCYGRCVLVRSRFASHRLLRRCERFMFPFVSLPLSYGLWDFNLHPACLFVLE